MRAPEWLRRWMDGWTLEAEMRTQPVCACQIEPRPLAGRNAFWLTFIGLIEYIVYVRLYTYMYIYLMRINHPKGLISWVMSGISGCSARWRSMRVYVSYFTRDWKTFIVRPYRPAEQLCIHNKGFPRRSFIFITVCSSLTCAHNGLRLVYMQMPIDRIERMRLFNAIAAAVADIIMICVMFTPKPHNFPCIIMVKMTMQRPYTRTRTTA